MHRHRLIDPQFNGAGLEVGRNRFVDHWKGFFLKHSIHYGLSTLDCAIWRTRPHEYLVHFIVDEFAISFSKILTQHLHLLNSERSQLSQLFLSNFDVQNVVQWIPFSVSKQNLNIQQLCLYLNKGKKEKQYQFFHLNYQSSQIAIIYLILILIMNIIKSFLLARSFLAFSNQPRYLFAGLPHFFK